MYGPDVAAIHDDLYELRGKDYADEAAYVAAVVRSRAPDARSLLDVGCGTGAHLIHLRKAFDHVEGMDLSEAMLAEAAAKLPTTPLHHGDMHAFDLGRRFDAVVCLFASIAHTASVAELTSTLRCFARHLAEGGVVVVEPRWFREQFVDGYVAGDALDTGHGVITRVSHTVREDDMWVMDVQFLVADTARGIRHFGEHYRHRLFSRAEYEEAFTAAGLEVEYVEEVQDGRGLFVGRLLAGDGSQTSEDLVGEDSRPGEVGEVST